MTCNVAFYTSSYLLSLFNGQDNVERAVPSPVGDVKTMSSISNFVPVEMTFSLAALGEAPEGAGPPPYF